jgi:hypothetical protein
LLKSSRFSKVPPIKAKTHLPRAGSRSPSKKVEPYMGIKKKPSGSITVSFSNICGMVGRAV